MIAHNALTGFARRRHQAAIPAAHAPRLGLSGVRSKLSLALAASVVAIAGANSAHASSIGVSAFTNPIIATYGNPAGVTQAEGSSLKIGSATFSQPSGSELEWWAASNGYLDCNGGCVTDTGQGALDVTFASPSALAGLYVGQATAYTLDVLFYDAANKLLGTDVVSNASNTGGLTFAGWQSNADPISSIEVERVSNNGYYVSIQSSYRQAAAVPEPASLALIVAGVAGLGITRRRKSA